MYMFLSHLDDPHYMTSVMGIEAALLLSPTVTSAYLIPEIAGTLDKIAPQRARPPSETRPLFNDHVQSMADTYDT